MGGSSPNGIGGTADNIGGSALSGKSAPLANYPLTPQINGPAGLPLTFGTSGSSPSGVAHSGGPVTSPGGLQPVAGGTGTAAPVLQLQTPGSLGGSIGPTGTPIDTASTGPVYNSNTGLPTLPPPPQPAGTPTTASPVALQGIQTAPATQAAPTPPADTGGYSAFGGSVPAGYSAFGGTGGPVPAPSTTAANTGPVPAPAQTAQTAQANGLAGTGSSSIMNQQNQQTGK